MLQHGVGTITFYEPETKEFAALGHGILDVDTSKLIDIGKGELVTSKIVSIVKGENGKPGEIKGSIENGTSIGEINKNTFFGIYGKINNSTPLNINTQNAIEVANRNEIKTGEATIFICLTHRFQTAFNAYGVVHICAELLVLIAGITVNNGHQFTPGQFLAMGQQRSILTKIWLSISNFE